MAEYKLLENGVLRTSDGAHIPKNESNVDYRQFLMFCSEHGLLDASSNVLPDNVLIEDVSTRSLAEIKEEAKRAVDLAAGQARARYITTAPGQEMVYILKTQEATQCVNDSTPSAEKYPFVAADSIAFGVDLMTAAQMILAVQQQWFVLGAKIEEIRLTAKETINSKLRESTVIAARDTAINQLTQI